MPCGPWRMPSPHGFDPATGSCSDQRSSSCALLWRAQRVIGEYQGAGHAGIRARSRDSHRNGLLTDEGWLVLEIFAEDHTDPHRKALMLNRFARALDLDPATLRIAG